MHPKALTREPGEAPKIGVTYHHRYATSTKTMTYTTLKSTAFS